jgi:hypothetical protein
VKRGTQKIAVWGVVLGLVVALALGLRQIQSSLEELRLQRDRLAAGLRSLHAERRALREEESGLRQRAELRARETSDGEAKQAAQEEKVRELRQVLATVRAARASSSPRTPWRAYPTGKHGDIFPELLADPDYAQLHATYERRNVESRYAAFFATTSAAPDAVEKLKAALVQRAISELEREELIARHQVPAGQTAELAYLLAEKFNAEVREILGEVGAAEFQRHESTRAQRTAVDALARRLSYSEEPLSAAQTAELVTLMASAKEPYGRQMIPARKFNAEVLERAGAVLTPAQWEQLKQFSQEQEAVARP